MESQLLTATNAQLCP